MFNSYSNVDSTFTSWTTSVFLFVALSSSVFLFFFCSAVKAVKKSVALLSLSFLTVISPRSSVRSLRSRALSDGRSQRGMGGYGQIDWQVDWPYKSSGPSNWLDDVFTAGQNGWFPCFFPNHFIFWLLSWWLEIVYKYRKTCFWTTLPTPAWSSRVGQIKKIVLLCYLGEAIKERVTSKLKKTC